MNKNEFLNNEDVRNFIIWASDFLRDSLQANLFISSKGTKNAGVVEGQFKGLNQITNAYKWKSKWKNSDGFEIESIDWNTTSNYLASLGNALRNALDEKNTEVTFELCREIIKWGGGLRNPNVGAIKFLTDKKVDGSLCKYLTDCQYQLRLDNANDSNLNNIGDMNAMLTKVHAIASTDGLPIYDSRVAGAIACIIEIYFIKTHSQRMNLPKELTFKSTDPAIRRQVNGLCSTSRVPNGITRGTDNHELVKRSSEWAFSKIRLGWLMRAIIDKADQNKKTLFDPKIKENKKEMHAFEAALFMIGFDVSCLKPNLETN